MSVGNSSSVFDNNIVHHGANYDVCVNYYPEQEDIYLQLKYEKNVKYFFRSSRCSGAYQSYNHIIKNNDFWKKYKYIMLLYDDIKIDYKILNDIFTESMLLNVDIAQPSTHEIYSSYKHLITKPNSEYRHIPFVEIRMPIFKINVFENMIAPSIEKYVDTCKLSSGWGLDISWYQYAKENNLKTLVFDKYVGTNMYPPNNDLRKSSEMVRYVQHIGVDLSILSNL